VAARQGKVREGDFPLASIKKTAINLCIFRGTTKIDLYFNFNDKSENINCFSNLIQISKNPENDIGTMLAFRGDELYCILVL